MSANAGPSKDPRTIAGMFDAIAGRYDLLNHVLSGGLDWQWRRRAVRELGLTGRERVIDLCTGTADLAMTALRARPVGARQVVGIDFSAEMLRVGQRKVRAAGLDGRAPLVRGDAMGLPVVSASADAAMIAFGIRNVVDPLAACREIRRVLRPGGRLAVLEFAMPTAPVMRSLYAWYFRNVLPRVGRVVSRHSDAYDYLPASVGTFFAPDEFSALVRSAGFDDVRAVPLTLGIVYLYVARKPADGGVPAAIMS